MPCPPNECHAACAVEDLGAHRPHEVGLAVFVGESEVQVNDA
eukprot:CAMPEP_0115311180 /NCGR_PEP_ID=MMETSP0270-20121206/75193_1 /TAXON_ID=71861 /ORGANISM="Scrippsiella trochoidea, Strain CCMP3099" /LENGTH=41 /DNA_ID= /DNA_START= /DNA_END= /DNA_ORIENTATION=